MQDVRIDHPDHTVWPNGLFEVDEDFETRDHLNISIQADLFFDFLRVLYGTNCKEEIEKEISRRIDNGNLSKTKANALLQRFIHVYHAFGNAVDDRSSISMRGAVKYL